MMTSLTSGQRKRKKNKQMNLYQIINRYKTRKDEKTNRIQLIHKTLTTGHIKLLYTATAYVTGGLGVNFAIDVIYLHVEMCSEQHQSICRYLQGYLYQSVGLSDELQAQEGQTCFFFRDSVNVQEKKKRLLIFFSCLSPILFFSLSDEEHENTFRNKL